MGVSAERLAEVDSALEELGKTAEEVTETRARVRGQERVLTEIDAQLNELSTDAERAEALLAKVRSEHVSSLVDDPPEEPDEEENEAQDELGALLDDDDGPGTDEHAVLPPPPEPAEASPEVAPEPRSVDSEVDQLVDAVIDIDAVMADPAPPADHLLEDDGGLSEDELFDSDVPPDAADPAADYSAYLVDSELPPASDAPLNLSDELEAEEKTVMVSPMAEALLDDAPMGPPIGEEAHEDSTAVFDPQDLAAIEAQAGDSPADSTIPFATMSQPAPAPAGATEPVMMPPADPAFGVVGAEVAQRPMRCSKMTTSRFSATMTLSCFSTTTWKTPSMWTWTWETRIWAARPRHRPKGRAAPERASSRRSSATSPSFERLT